VTYLLDTMIVSYFLETAHEATLAEASRELAMVMVGEVRSELRKDPRRGRPAFDRWLATSAIEVREIVVGSPASATLAQLVNPASPRQDLGERASIAMPASDETLAFVTHDKAAVWLALRELWQPGERIVGLAPFLRRLVELDLVDAEVLDDIMGIAIATALRPTWWPTFRAGLNRVDG
jgi:hypothetical protein